MGELVTLNFWKGLADDDILHACPHCDCAEFFLMADSRVVCCNCESLVTNLRTEENHD
jgi:hypothetical protein